MGDRVYERFVECPEVIEIRWVSDDPDHHRPSEDMFNCQANGIPEDYGKKDKRTTEQAHFYCCVCECQSASLKTLRAHCEGTQHKRKAEQFFQQYQYKQRKLNSFNESISSEDISKINGSRHIHLSELYRRTPLVGLQYVEAYKSSDKHDPPLYMCILKNCKVNNCEFQGEAELMFEHLKSEAHTWSYFRRIYGNEFVQEHYDYEELLKRTIHAEDKRYKEQYVKANARDYQSVQNGNRPDSSYIRETIELKEEERQPSRALPPRSKLLSQNEPESNNLTDINTSIEGQNGKVEGGSVVKTEPATSVDSQRKNTLKRKLSQSDSGQMQDKVCRTTYSAENPLCTLPPSLQIEAKPDLSLIDENQLSSISPDQKQPPAINGYHNSEFAVSSAQAQIQNPVKKFNQELAYWVMSCMNKYYQYEKNRDTCIRKISDQVEYENVAKDFSRNMRKSEKESYISTNGTYDGLELNLDMKDRVKMNIDMYFENLPLLPLD